MSFSNPFVYKKEAFSTIKIFMMNFLFSLYIWMTKRSQILFYFLQIWSLNDNLENKYIQLWHVSRNLVCFGLN